MTSADNSTKMSAIVCLLVVGFVGINYAYADSYENCIGNNCVGEIDGSTMIECNNADASVIAMIFGSCDNSTEFAKMIKSTKVQINETSAKNVNCVGNGCNDNLTHTVYLGFVKPTVNNDGCGSSWNPHCMYSSLGCKDWRNFVLWSWAFKC